MTSGARCPPLSPGRPTRDRSPLGAAAQRTLSPRRTRPARENQHSRRRVSQTSPRSSRGHQQCSQRAAHRLLCSTASVQDSGREADSSGAVNVRPHPPQLGLRHSRLPLFSVLPRPGSTGSAAGTGPSPRFIRRATTSTDVGSPAAANARETNSDDQTISSERPNSEPPPPGTGSV